jgi:long-chain acyl-CoA synthetase
MDCNLTEIPALEQLRNNPAAIAITDGETHSTWEDFFDGALDVVDLLKSRDVMPGQHAAILSGNNKEYYEVLLGAVIAGVWLTPVNSHLTGPEVDYVLADSGAKVLFTDREELLAKSDFAVALSLERKAEKQHGDSQQVYARLIDLLGEKAGGFLMYTSGTTGQPKGVKRNSPGSLLDALKLWRQTGTNAGLNGEGAHLVTGPIYHAAPGMFSFYDLINGASLVLMRRWNTQSCLEMIEHYSIVRTHLVPTMFVRLLRDRKSYSRQYDLSSLRMVLHGAAPVSRQIKREMIAWWGEVLVEYWGASESGIITRVDSVQWLAHPGTVGKPLAHFEVSVRDEVFNELARGQIGSLYARKSGAPRPYHYFNDNEKTEGAYVDDWFTLGDLGWQDESGYIYIADRRSNLIISGGVNIYPAEVEGVLLEHGSVADVAVIGLADEEWGKRVHAIVQPVPGRDPTDNLVEELLDFACTRLAKFKIPRSVEIVESLPRYDSGKLYLNRLGPSEPDR